MFVPGSIPNIILSLVINKLSSLLKKTLLYKYINLLLRFAIGVVAVWFIYIKINNEFIEHLDFKNVNVGLILIIILLLFANWGLEALKWKFAIRSVEKISFIKAFKIIFTGITMGLLTPNRVGEIPSRAILLSKDKFKEITLKTIVASFSQVWITFLFGGIGLLLVWDYFQTSISVFFITIFITIVLGLLLLFYFNVRKLDSLFKKFKFLREKELIKALNDFSFGDLLKLLFLSFLRYIIFYIQYWLILKAFGIELSIWNEVFLIPVCFLFTSFIPTILISEIGVRGSVALFVFGLVSDMELQIVLASVSLWLINVALPALLGLYNLKELKLLKEK